VKVGAVLLAALALGLVGCGASTSNRVVRPQVRELRSVDELRRAFNAHSGVPRLIVLVSPT